MNRIPRYNTSQIALASVGLIGTIIGMIFLKFESYFYIIFVLMILSCIYLFIKIFRLADIEVSGDVLTVDILSKERKINLVDLKIYDIKIVMHPLFLMRTSAGNFEIDYTNENYQQILELLRITSYNELELFKRKADNYIVGFRRNKNQGWRVESR